MIKCSKNLGRATLCLEIPGYSKACETGTGTGTAAVTWTGTGIWEAFTGMWQGRADYGRGRANICRHACRGRPPLCTGELHRWYEVPQLYAFLSLQNFCLYRLSWKTISAGWPVMPPAAGVAAKWSSVCQRQKL